MEYQIGIGYSNGHLTTIIRSVQSSNISLSAAPSFPIKNEELAKVYIKGIMSSLEGKPTLGDGFPMGQIENPNISINSECVKIQ